MHKHLTHIQIAAETLLRDHEIRAFDSVYRLTCSCGQPKRNTRLAATIWQLRHEYGWNIETIEKPGLLAEYILHRVGAMPKRGR